MKIMKPFTKKVWEPLLEKFEYYDTRTGNLRRRWWTKARIPGMRRASTLPDGSAHHPVKYGARMKRRMAA